MSGHWHCGQTLRFARAAACNSTGCKTKLDHQTRDIISVNAETLGLGWPECKTLHLDAELDGAENSGIEGLPPVASRSNRVLASGLRFLIAG